MILWLKRRIKLWFCNGNKSGHVKKYLLITEYKRVLIQPGERRRNQLTNKSKAQSEKYSPLWKCWKLFIPPQTDGDDSFFPQHRLFESKIICKWRKTKTTQKQKGFSRRKRSHLVHILFSLSQNFSQQQTNTVEHTQHTQRKARLEPAIRDAQKLAQNVFPPWMLQ